MHTSRLEVQRRSAILKLFCFLYLLSASIKLIRCYSNENYTSTHRHITNTQSNYFNHRIDSSNSSSLNSNSTLYDENQDRFTSDSILRPQLALQIFTSNQIPTTSEDNFGQQQSKIPQQVSRSNSASNAMLILPLPQLEEQHQYTENRVRISQEKKPVDSNSQDSDMNKLKPWHYITDQPEAMGFTATSTNVSPNVDGARNLGSPLINAIISVPPTLSEHHHHHHHTEHKEKQNFAESLSPKTSSSSKQSLSNLVENQPFEFNMNLNTDEIILNPINGKQSLMSNMSSDFSRHDHEVQDKSKRNDRNFKLDERTISRALRKHVESELGVDQPSASEVDLINDSIGDHDDNIESREDRDDEDEMVRPKSKNLDPIGIAKGHWNDADSNIDIDEQTADESYHESRFLNNNQRFNRDHDLRDGRVKKSSWKKEPKRSKYQSQKDQSNLPNSNRNTSGSKRRLVFKADDSRDSPSTTVEESRGASPVMIKGEDVRRFEQLLENLRSLSIANLNTAKSKRVSRLSSKQSPDYSTSDENQDLYNKNSNQDASSSAGDANSKSWNDGDSYQRKNQGSNRIAQSESSDDNDCDRRRQKSRQLSESSTSFDTDTLPNIVDQDPITSSDGDDLNDESSNNQNVEQEEQSSDNHNKVVASNEAHDRRSLHQHSDNDSQQKDEDNQAPAKSHFVRKTILQDFYDNNSKHGTSARPKEENDDFGEVHKAHHSAQHEKLKNTGNSDAAIVKQMLYLTGGHVNQRRIVPSRYQQNENKDLSPINNYIDYNQLDDREVYRGSESQKFKVTMPSREQLERMRSLQQVIERAAIEENKAKSNS